MKVYIVETWASVDYEGSWSMIKFASTNKEDAEKAFQGWCYVCNGNADNNGATLYEMEDDVQVKIAEWCAHEE